MMNNNSPKPQKPALMPGPPWARVLPNFAAVLLLSGLAARGAEYEPGGPGACLFDTGASAAAPLPAAKLDPKSWTLIPEDNLTHKFQGDAAFLNDRLIVVLRGQGPGAEVYSQLPAGPKQRVVLTPSSASGSGAVALAGVKIVENGPGAVLLAGTFKTAEGGVCSAKFRLSAGQIMIEVRPDEGQGRLAVRAEGRYAVVPDFFGDDMVFGGDDLSRALLRLPAENFLLNLLDNGNAAVMCVWQSGGQGATAVRAATRKGETKSPSRPAAISACEIETAKDKAVWIACLEAPGTWHEQSIAPGDDRPSRLEVGWKPPYSAQWRADVLDPSGEAESHWWQAGKPLKPNAQPARTLLLYAMDRTPTTALTAFTPMDVLRNTLGVGPCQYILQTEGLASDGNSTPEGVMAFVEKQFSKKREKKAAEEIRERLDQMVAYIGQAESRIERYRRQAAELSVLCGSAPAGKTSLAPVAVRLERAAAAPTATTDLRARAKQLADSVAALVGKANALADCEALGKELRILGADQDRRMANCRMAARWLKQSALMLAEDQPRDADLAKKVQALAEKALETK
jgi:hypothetical protein